MTLDYENQSGADGARRAAVVPPEGPGSPEGDATAEGSGPTVAPAKPHERALGTVARLVKLVQSSDDKAVEEAVLSLSRSRRWLAPLAMIVGAFLMLFRGLKLLFTNWRLTLVQVLPAMWIWVAMLDIKLHVLHGKQFHIVRGPILIPLALAVTALTAGSFFLNAVFAFAVTAPDTPRSGPPSTRLGAT